MFIQIICELGRWPSVLRCMKVKDGENTPKWQLVRSCGRTNYASLLVKKLTAWEKCPSMFGTLRERHLLRLTCFSVLEEEKNSRICQTVCWNKLGNKDLENLELMEVDIGSLLETKLFLRAISFANGLVFTAYSVFSIEYPNGVKQPPSSCTVAFVWMFSF